MTAEAPQETEGVLLLEQVFKRSGIPTYTFVKPAEYQRILVSLRTPGRGLVVEGPSGIGKTTCIVKALEELGIDHIILSARRREDREIIDLLPETDNLGTVIIEDFHRLSEKSKLAIADKMKLLADEENETSKVVTVGINKAGDTLIKLASDLVNRIDVVRFESNSEEKIAELVRKGSDAMNIEFNTAGDIVAEAEGSFHIGQMLCNETCLLAGVTERPKEKRQLSISINSVRERVLDELSANFHEIARKFATGPRLRREGRAPYLHLLNWLSTDPEWHLQIDHVLALHPEHRGSVSQIVDKGYLSAFINENDDLSNVFHYDDQTRILSVEDPKLIYYLRNLLWNKFAARTGFLNLEFPSKYDFALSFSGTDRAIAEKLFETLSNAEVEVFYDKNEQHRILAEDVEDYLRPIYKSEAQFVVVLLGRDYPTRIWTKFESEQFRNRFGSGSVIPIWFSDTPTGAFDESKRVGGLTIDREKPIDEQIEILADVLLNKLRESRASAEDPDSRERTSS